MNIVFFLYEIATGIIILLLPDVPDNDNFETTCEIWHEGKRVARGLKWDKIAFEIIDPVEIDDPTPQKYMYNNGSGEITINPNYVEEPIL